VACRRDEGPTDGERWGKEDSRAQRQESFGRQENFAEPIQKARPKPQEILQQVAEKLEVDRLAFRESRLSCSNSFVRG
jgi:hypothetical protein